MPLYEYQCDACDHRFEVIQKFSDALVEVCPKCGGHVQKLLSSPAIQFKGSGWYITDYARAGKSDGGKVASGKNDTGGTTAEGQTDAKPASDGAKTDSAKSGGAKTDSKPTASSSTSD